MEPAKIKTEPARQTTGWWDKVRCIWSDKACKSVYGTPIHTLQQKCTDANAWTFRSGRDDPDWVQHNACIGTANCTYSDQNTDNENENTTSYRYHCPRTCSKQNVYPPSEAIDQRWMDAITDVAEGNVLSSSDEVNYIKKVIDTHTVIPAARPRRRF